MQLEKLTTTNKIHLTQGADQEVSAVTADSRLAKTGSLFVAIPGTQVDGRTFIKDALQRGASALLVPENTDLSDIPANITVLTAHDMRSALSYTASCFYVRQPEMIAAITGTSGKTSTAQFTMELWRALGLKSASIGTLGVVTEEGTHYGSLTTPDPLTLHQSLDEVTGHNITHVAMEASSHGIILDRLDYVNIKTAAFTNLSRDHLDYHETMEAYLQAKMRLFTTLLPEASPVVLNADIPEFPTLVSACQKRNHKIISFGEQGQDLRIEKITPDPAGQIIAFTAFGKKTEILLPVIGSFQVWNSLCALGLVIGSGGDTDQAITGLQKLSGVPGRLQLIGQTKTGGTVFVDYAHKPDALQNVLNGLRPHVAAKQGAKLGVVFGCGGNRDPGKRPIMGEIAQRLADWTIVTDDNPRREEPALIRQAVLSGCKASPSLREIGDRAEAIRTGIADLHQGDVLVIAGKGHEVGQIVGDKTLPFDDAEVARQAMEIRS